MKKTFVIILVFMSLLASSKTTMAQNTKVEGELVAALRDQGYEVSETLYADVKEGGTTYHWKKYYGGLNYFIAVFPEEEGVNDLDAYLYDEDGYLLLKSVTDKNYEFLKFTYSTTRNLKVVVKNYDSYSSTYKYRLKFVIFYKKADSLQ